MREKLLLFVVLVTLANSAYLAQQKPDCADDFIELSQVVIGAFIGRLRDSD